MMHVLIGRCATQPHFLHLSCSSQQQQELDSDHKLVPTCYPGDFILLSFTNDCQPDHSKPTPVHSANELVPTQPSSPYAREPQSGRIRVRPDFF